MSCICAEKVERQQPKVTCSNCKSIFHAKCVNLLADDIDYLKKNKKNYYCSICAAQRRSSINAVTDTVMNNRETWQRNSTSDDSVLTSSCVTLSALKQQPIPNNGMASTSVNKDVTNAEILNELLSIKMLLADSLKRIDNLEAANNSLLQKLAYLESKVHVNEQIQKENFVEVVNLPNVTNLNACDTAMNIFNNGLDLKVEKYDIQQAYVKTVTIQKNSGGSIKKTILCVQLRNNLIKKEIMKEKLLKRKKLRDLVFGKNSNSILNNVYINHSFTPYFRMLYSATMKFKLEHKYRYCWVDRSCILLRKSEGGSVISVRCLEDLKNID